MTIAASPFRPVDRSDHTPVAAFPGLLYALPMSAVLWLVIILVLRVVG